MKESIYAIFDIATTEYSPVFQCKNVSIALRITRNQYRTLDESTLKDLSLYVLGDINTESGEITATQPKLINTEAMKQEVLNAQR